MRVLIAAAAVMAASMGSSALAQEDFDAGEKVFRKCMACHMTGPDAKNRVGPVLNGVVGRPWGAIGDFKYSDNLVELAADGRTWNTTFLTDYLRNPKDVIPKGRMAFAGLRKDDEIANVIFYLASFDADGNSVDAGPVIEAATE